MAGWVGPTIAISLLVIAVCYVTVLAGMAAAARAAARRVDDMAREVSELRRELAPALDAFQRFSASGIEVANEARDEVRQIVDGVHRVRVDVEAGINRTRRRLADFEAMIDVVQEEVEDTALDLASALHTARAGVGIVGQLRRLIRPRSRRRRRR
jgi:hypothetical protein